MRCLITGAGGFAGSHLAERLLKRGCEVSGLLRPNDGLQNLSSLIPVVRVERGDLLDEDRILDLIKSLKPNRIYHLAALSSPEESLQNPSLTYEVNLRGTLNLLEAWRQSQIDSRFLYVSSSAVYGYPEAGGLPLKENSPLRPASPYAGSKAAAEMLCVQYHYTYGFPILMVRPFNHTGPRQDSRFVCSGFARQAAEIESGLRPPMIKTGNLDVSRDFSDVRDIVRGYDMLLESGSPGQVYQLCSGRATSIRTILDTIMAKSSRPAEIQSDPLLMRSHEAQIVYGDYSKAKQITGWTPEYSLESTLNDLKNYWQGALRLAAT